VSYESVVDDQGEASRAFHVSSLPTLVAIDATGQVKAVRKGLVSEKELSALVESILPPR
jgi:predicted transcriptional regulator